MGELAILGREGDVKTIWSRNDPDEVAVARKQFGELLAKGFQAFKVEGKEGEKGERATIFDPNAERYIFAKPLAGG